MVGTRLRRMQIDGRAFAWRAEIRYVRGSADDHRCIRVRCWGAGKTSQALEADLLSPTWPAPCGTCSIDGVWATDDAHPTPRDIRALIDYALDHGWQPELTGGTFPLSERTHARFCLPAFVLTDRLRTPESEDPSARVIRAYEARLRREKPAT